MAANPTSLVFQRPLPFACEPAVVAFAHRGSTSPPPNVALSTTHPLTYDRSLITRLVALILMAAMLTGCRQELKTGYGRARGDDYFASVNGTVVFHQMLETNGQRVRRYAKYSKRWEQYDTIYWIPDSFFPPSAELIERIEGWLAASNDRTFVYVARDFDATWVYWDQLHQRSTDHQQSMARDRQFLEHAIEHESRKLDRRFSDCDWYELEHFSLQKAKLVEGELADGASLKNFDLRYASLPQPVPNHNASVQLNVDGRPFVYTIEKPKFQNSSRLVVVGNASFLLNLPLAQRPNRHLAFALIDYVGENQPSDQEILFIESNGPLPIDETIQEESASQWQWIKQQPMRYIVPNVLLCLLLYCFVYFPIFGRPKSLPGTPTSDFRDHVRALAALMQRTKSPELLRQWIDDSRRAANKSAADSSGIESKTGGDIPPKGSETSQPPARRRKIDIESADG